MDVTIDLPAEGERLLRAAFGEDLSRAAVDAMAVEGYRSGKFSRYDIQKILGFTNRWDAEEWLGARGLTMDYSVSDLEADRRTLDAILGVVKQ